MQKRLLRFTAVWTGFMACLAGSAIVVLLAANRRPAVSPPLGELPQSLEQAQQAGQAFIGHTEETIVTRFGIPNLRYEGCFPAFGPPPAAYSSPITLVYGCATGDLYLLTCQKGEGRVCVNWTWLPKGSKF